VVSIGNKGHQYFAPFIHIEEVDMKPIEIADGIFDVGVTDWNIRDFHGYSTHRGTSYNAFLILDEKIVLIDTVKKEFADHLMGNIAQIVDPQKIDAVISNHTEMDHSGSLFRIMPKIGPDKPLFCSKVGQQSLSRHFPQRWNYRAVGNGEELNLGKRNLMFLETRMVHWPDSMFTYLKEDKILFSSDGFGQHYAGQEKFDDQVEDNVILPHAKKYFANILLLYAPLILKLIKQVTDAGLEINMICPDHGILWRKNPAKIIEAYGRWSKHEAKKKAVVVYDTMWQSTQKMAEAITDGLIEEDIAVKPMHLRKWHRSDIMTEVLDARAVVVGSPTLNNGLFPTLSDFLTYMKGLKPKNKIGAAFGSYGWSGESVKLIQKELEAMQFEIMEPSLSIQYVPDDKGLDACIQYGKKIGQAINGG
jgi:flavorubredoxin